MSEITKVKETNRVLRFAMSSRIEHWVLTISFAVLGLTGLVQTFADVSLSQWLVRLMGGIEIVRLIHHVAAFILMLEAIYHIGALGYRVFVQRAPLTMVPWINDAQAAIQAVLYNLGLRKVPPREGRYTFAEKMEYWALVWGTVVMGITGFMLWNPIATTKFLPGELVPVAKMAHAREAVLAVAAIFIWHIYHVHIRHWNWSMFTGFLSKKEMAEEHPLELAYVESGPAPAPVAPQTLKRRKQIFFPIYAAIAAVMLVAVYFFVGFEQTAIATVPPPEQVVVYAPLTPTPMPTPLPTPTPAAKVATTWDGGFADLFKAKCVTCHSSANKMGGIDCSSYAAVVAGGTSGPGVVPGKPDSSSVVTKQVPGTHPGQFSGEELALIRKWIEAGAPEK